MGARSKRDARWSVSLSVSVRSGSGPWIAAPDLASAPELRRQLRCVDAARYRWRYDAKQFSVSFKLPAEADAAVAFRQMLVAAMAGDWPASLIVGVGPGAGAVSVLRVCDSVPVMRPG